MKLVRHDTLWFTVDAVLACLFAGFCCFTSRFTEPVSEKERPHQSPLAGVQLACCLLVVFATGIGGLAWHHVTPSWLIVPGWDALRQAVFDAAAQRLSGSLANGVANFWAYCVPIAVLLLVLGVPLSQLGLGRFRRGSARTAAVWLVVPLGVFAWALLAGKASAMTILGAWLSNLLQNGFSEEFLFRGALMGRLRTLLRDDHAILVQALIFGAWHAGADFAAYHGNVLDAIADMIASQALFGMAAGFVTLRSGNIAIASAFHLLFDSLQIFQ